MVNCDLCQHHSSSTNCTQISLRDCQSNCPAYSRQLAQKPGWMNPASFPRNLNPDWGDKDWKWSEFMLLPMSSADLSRFPGVGPFASFQFSEWPHLIGPSVLFLLKLIKCWCWLLLLASREHWLTTLQRDRYQNILIKVCLYHVLIIEMTNIKLKSVS